MLGDLEERFHSDLETVSAKRARWRYRGRVWRSLGPLIFNKLRSLDSSRLFSRSAAGNSDGSTRGAVTKDQDAMPALTRRRDPDARQES